ncbi:MAG: dTMP kinase [Actinomycetes bacterium]
MTGRFVVLEGADGTGKSTQVARLAAWVRSAGGTAVETREPGGTPDGARIRAVLLDGTGPLDARAEALLMAADRAQALAELVRPALARGEWVISDRHVPSSLVYQGVGRDLGVDEVARINAWATAGTTPDLVVVLDLPDDVADARRAARDGGDDRMERESAAFHARVRTAYRDLARAEGWALLDAGGTADEVGTRLVELVEARLGRPSPP